MPRGQPKAKHPELYKEREELLEAKRMQERLSKGEGSLMGNGEDKSGLLAPLVPINPSPSNAVASLNPIVDSQRLNEEDPRPLSALPQPIIFFSLVPSPEKGLFRVMRAELNKGDFTAEYLTAADSKLVGLAIMHQRAQHEYNYPPDETVI